VGEKYGWDSNIDVCQWTETTVMLEIINAEHHAAGLGDGSNSWEIDVIQDVCHEGSSQDFEPFGDDFVSFTLNVTPLSEGSLSGHLSIETYAVEFFPRDGKAPPIETIEAFANFIIQSTESQLHIGYFLIMDAGRKTKVARDLVEGNFSPKLLPVIYDMRITLRGRDDLDNPIKLIFEKTIQLANFNSCP
jgi:hypothetical protein